MRLALWPFFLASMASGAVLYDPLAISPMQSASIAATSAPTIDIRGLGPGRSFTRTMTLSLQLLNDLPEWTFVNQKPGADMFIGTTEDGKVHAHLYRYMNGETDLLVGNIQDTEHGMWYEIKPDATGTDTMVNVVDSRDIPRKYEHPKKNSTSTGSAPQEEGVQPLIGSDTVVDLMVVGTINAECAKSGLPEDCVTTRQTRENMIAAIEFFVNEMNLALENSDVDLTINFVHYHLDVMFDETGWEMGEILEEFSGEFDMYYDFDDIPDLRAEHGADLVMLLVDRDRLWEDGALGVAWGDSANSRPTADYGFSVVQVQWTSLEYTPAHELGHNFGCDHDRGSEDACDVSNHPETNYGYRGPNNEFLTVMAIPSDGTECDGLPADESYQFNYIPYFSGTSVYESETLGAPDNNCAAQIRASKDTIASWYTKVASEFPSEMPSEWPTETPTASPSKESSQSPSRYPSNVPSQPPTSAPTRSTPPPIAPKPQPVPAPPVPAPAPELAPAPAPEQAKTEEAETDDDGDDRNDMLVFRVFSGLWGRIFGKK